LPGRRSQTNSSASRCTPAPGGAGADLPAVPCPPRPAGARRDPGQGPDDRAAPRLRHAATAPQAPGDGGARPPCTRRARRALGAGRPHGARHGPPGARPVSPVRRSRRRSWRCRRRSVCAGSCGGWRSARRRLRDGPADPGLPSSTHPPDGDHVRRRGHRSRRAGRLCQQPGRPARPPGREAPGTGRRRPRHQPAAALRGRPQRPRQAARLRPRGRPERVPAGPRPGHHGATGGRGARGLPYSDATRGNIDVPILLG
jgi:hypothetical protein